MSAPRFSVCIDAVYESVPEVEAIARAASAGVDAIEYWKWWDKDLAAIEDARMEHGLDLAGFCTKFVSLVDPSRRQEYLDGLGETLATATRLGAGVVISQVGDALPDAPRESQRESLIEGLRAAAPMVEEAGVVLAFEPLNVLVDHPGYYLVRSDEAFDIARAVGRPAVKVLFDLYHQQVSEGHLIANLTRDIGLIGHFHAAGNPGRHELDVGEVHYPAVFEAIAATGYDGFIGLEYWPTRRGDGEIEAGLAKAVSGDASS